MAELLSIDPSHPTPLYAQIEDGIRAAIAAGRLALGDQLPTVRRLAVELRVNANTIARVYAELERAGVLETRRGVGTFVATVPGNPTPDGGRTLGRLVKRWADEALANGFSLDEVADELKRISHTR